MKILLTGHKGFIGQNMYTSLSEDGHHVVGYEWEDDLPNVGDFDLVMHMGAISSTAEKDVEKVMKQNYDFSTNLIDTCVYNDIPVQFSSSGSVYGRGTEFKETSPVFPMSPYAWSKYLVEKYCRKYSNAKIQFLRYFNVYSSEGESESHKVGQCSPHYKFRKQAENLKKIELFIHPKNRTSSRDFIDVEEVIDLQKKLMKTNSYGIFNIGTGRSKTFEQVAIEISQQYEVDIEEIPMPEDIAGYIQWYTCADMTKTHAAIAKVT